MAAKYFTIALIALLFSGFLEAASPVLWNTNDCGVEALVTQSNNLETAKQEEIIRILNAKSVTECTNAAEFIEVFNEFVYLVLEKRPEVIFDFLEQAEPGNYQAVLGHIATPVAEPDLVKIREVVAQALGEPHYKQLVLSTMPKL